MHCISVCVDSSTLIGLHIIMTWLCVQPVFISGRLRPDISLSEAELGTMHCPHHTNKKRFPPARDIYKRLFLLGEVIVKIKCEIKKMNASLAHVRKNTGSVHTFSFHYFAIFFSLFKSNTRFIITQS